MKDYFCKCFAFTKCSQKISLCVCLMGFRILSSMLPPSLEIYPYFSYEPIWIHFISSRRCMNITIITRIDELRPCRPELPVKWVRADLHIA